MKKLDPVIKVHGPDDSKNEAAGIIIQGFINVVLDEKFPKTIISLKAKMKYVDGGKEVLYIEVVSGNKILPLSKVEEICLFIKDQTEGFLVYFIPQDVWALSGEGLLPS